MRIVICDTGEAATGRVARRIAETVTRKPDAVLGLATGGTMDPVYRALIAEHEGGLSFAAATSFNLDEYVGLPPAHPQSYHSYMATHFFDHVDLPRDRRFLPRGDHDPDVAAADYEALIARHGPIDLQLLGLGHNGHIGFNEPGSSLASRTRDKALTRRTREANARFFAKGETPPDTAITMGIGTIMEARAVILLALGPGKAAAAAQVIEGPVSAICPGSALQFHPDVTIVLDEAAAADLTLKAHYREAEALHRSHRRAQVRR